MPERFESFNNSVLFSEKSHQEREEDAQDDAGDDWEMKTEVALRIVNIAGQLSEPSFADAAPKQRADDNEADADYDERFSDLRHSGVL